MDHKQDYDITWDIVVGKQLKKLYQYIKKNQSESVAAKIRNTIVERMDGLRRSPRILIEHFE